MDSFSTIRRKSVLTALFLGLVFALIGCSSSTERPKQQGVIGPDVAPGLILVEVRRIDLSESGQPKIYYQYEVQPATGTVRKVKEERFQDDVSSYGPTGAIEGCHNDPQASSLDQEYLAYCRRGEADEFFVDDKKTAHSLYHGTLGDKREIRGFGWAPNSRSVAFLNSSSRWGKTPMELFSALSGHPVPHDTVFLTILNVGTGQMTEYLIRRDIPSALTRILKWSE